MTEKLRIKYQKERSLMKAYTEHFLNYIPRNLEYAVLNNYHQEVMDLYDSIDYVDFHIRQYLVGNARTLNRVMKETGRLKSCILYQEILLTQLILNLESIILQNELYELMQRHKRVKQKLLDQNS